MRLSERTGKRRLKEDKRNSRMKFQRSAYVEAEKVEGEINLKVATEMAARDQDEYEPEAIMDCRRDDEGDWQFKVKWLGWSEDDSTWEYPEVLQDLDVFKLFMETHEEMKDEVQTYLKD
ncbi:hypothetical protein ADUPG1_001204, partial [Aduncisulcus paluster]